MRLRKLLPEDIDEVVKLVSGALSIEMEKVGESFNTASFKKQLIKSLSDKKIVNYVLMEDKQIIGFAQYQLEEICNQVEGTITTIVISKENRRNKCGTLLLNRIFKDLKGKVKRINLEVHLKNNIAQDFFKKFEFTKRTVEMSVDIDDNSFDA